MGGGGVGERRSLSTAKDYTLRAGVRKSEEREVGEGRGRQKNSLASKFTKREVGVEARTICCFL